MNIIEFRSDLFSSDPIVTEFYALQCLKRRPILQKVNYLAVPWSSLINNNIKLRGLPRIKGGFTVCQHIRYREIIPFLKKIGVDTIFTPHCDGLDRNIRVLPFPHYAINGIPPAPVKDIFYSFIGTDSPSKIGSSLRSTIFNLSHPQGVIVKKREFWHWAGELGWEKFSQEEQKRERLEYQDVLSRSRFSLCPRGVGAGTVRFWESLQAGAIPILISDALALPEGTDWSNCIIRVKEKDIPGIPDLLRGVSSQKEDAMRMSCIEAYKRYSGDSFVSVIRNTYKLKLYTFYTENNKILLEEWLKPSLKDNFELITKEGNQKKYSGNYKEEGWFDLMGQKVDCIIEAIRDNWGKLFIFADPDIQFFASVEQAICDIYKNEDMVFQKDSPNGIICAGFILCQANYNTLKLWLYIRKYVGKDRMCDQDWVNSILKKKRSIFDRIFNKHIIKWRYFPDEFFSGGTLSGKNWIPGEKLAIPQNILLHHANWTIGLQNKIAQLNYVRDVVKSRYK